MNIGTPSQRGFVLPGMKREVHDASADSTYSKRLPFIGFLPSGPRNHFIAMCGEFAGTFMFLLFAFGGTQVVNSNPTSASGSAANADPAKLLYISLCFGMSLAVNAWVFFRISGGLFNPAVTLGMCVVGAVPYLRGGLVVISQILGAISAAAVIDALTPGSVEFGTGLSGGASVVQGLFIEMFLTAQLVFTIFMLAAEKHKGTFIAPIGIGLSLFIAELLGVYYTGGAVNPARAFGPCVVLHSFHAYHWIYWIGPILGSLLAAGFYGLMKVLEYETANPAQDAADENETFDPETRRNEKPRVSFEPENYAAGRNMSGSTTDALDNGDRRHRNGGRNHDLESGIYPEVISSSAGGGGRQGGRREIANAQAPPERRSSGRRSQRASDPSNPPYATSPRNIHYNGGGGGAPPPSAAENAYNESNYHPRRSTDRAAEPLQDDPTSYLRRSVDRSRRGDPGYHTGPQMETGRRARP